MEKLNGVRGAIFDLDGTLLDSLWVWDEIDKRFLLRRGIDPPSDYLSVVNGMEFMQAAVYTIERFRLHERPESLCEEWSALAREAYAQEIPLKPYAKEYLAYLAGRGVRLGIATSSRPELYIPALERAGVHRLFSAATVTSEVPRGKQFPDVYLETAKRLGVSPADCAVFEDILHGVKSAKSAGFYTVGVADAYSAADKEEICRTADRYVESFALLLPA